VPLSLYYENATFLETSMYKQLQLHVYYYNNYCHYAMPQKNCANLLFRFLSVKSSTNVNKDQIKIG